jgi:hypothetical protein
VCPYYLDGDLGKSLAAPPGDTRVIGYCAVFKVREEAERDTRRHGTLIRTPPASRRSLKTQQHASRLAWTLRSSRAACQIRSTCLVADRARESVAELESSKATIRRRSVPSGCGGLPRKEVIQPQLPLRLPCYDFTPVASPTFDGTLLKG